MTSRGGDARACRPYLDRGVAALPPDALTHYAQLASFWFAYDFDQVQRLGNVGLAGALAALSHDKAVGYFDAPMGRNVRRRAALDDRERFERIGMLLV
jgi:hypothetical protein